MTEKITFLDDQGVKVELYVLEETKINGVNYLLVTEAADDEEGEAFIFKETALSESGDASYEPVEDEKELEYLGRIFQELLEDTDLI